MTKRLAPLGYKAAIEWLANNDDCYWVEDSDAYGPILSVSATMVADIYDRTHEEVTRDVTKAWKAMKCPPPPNN